MLYILLFYILIWGLYISMWPSIATYTCWWLWQFHFYEFRKRPKKTNNWDLIETRINGSVQMSSSLLWPTSISVRSFLRKRRLIGKRQSLPPPPARPPPPCTVSPLCFRRPFPFPLFSFPSFSSSSLFRSILVRRMTAVCIPPLSPTGGRSREGEGGRRAWGGASRPWDDGKEFRSETIDSIFSSSLSFS